MAKKSFEQAMEQLEKIVEELEAGDLPLDKAMQKFEEGMELTRFCTRKLDDTEKKISLLLRDKSGKVVEKPLLSDDEADEPT
ncbi:MAG: exodeoxyribonuclease VII small subunit [Deltaproteobacteria bacterium SG8_13]|nr:MAG: exodeoxyribonuclease VII small subunit [Deltaproteobacteria bacterium SG8_13]